jgi:hypothetical protein
MAVTTIPSAVSQSTASQDISRNDRERLLVTIHQLERALSSAAPTRERAWMPPVLSAMRSLESAMQQQYANADSADGLLSQIITDAPHLAPRVDRLKREYLDLLRQISTLRDQFESGSNKDALANFVDIRQRLAWLLNALRHHQSRETDLIFEAVNTDLGALD